MPKLATWLVVVLVGGAFVLGVAGGGLLERGGSSHGPNSASKTTPPATSPAPGSSTAAPKGAATSPGAAHKPVATGLVADRSASAHVRTQATVAALSTGTNLAPTTKGPSRAQKITTSGSRKAPKPARTVPPAAGPTPTPATPTSGGAVSNSGEPAAAAACKQDVQTQPTTSPGQKIHLERVCEKAARAPSGDTAAAAEVLEELQAALTH